MNTLARVLAAVDFSRPSRNAFDFAQNKLSGMTFDS